MVNTSALGTLSRLSEAELGVFRGHDAIGLGVTRKQLAALASTGVVVRVLPDTYRMTAVRRSNAQSLRAALLWAGPTAAAAGRSAGEVYDLEGVRATMPEIVVCPPNRVRSTSVSVHRSHERRPLMVRRWHGVRVTGVEATLVALAHSLEAETFEIACEDARRRRLTSMSSLRTYLDRYPGRDGAAPLHSLLDQLDPEHAARSTLEVKTRRLLVHHGITDFVREYPLEWNGRTYLFDFAFRRARTILETNGRRWHDDPNDFEHDNEKWSVPGRNGYRVVFATWDKVTHEPTRLVDELNATLAADHPRRSGHRAPVARIHIAGSPAPASRPAGFFLPD